MPGQGLVVETSKPGVIAIVNAAQVASPIRRQPTSTFLVVGYSAWGPVNTPTVITNWGDFVRTFGVFNANSFIDDALYVFFNFFPGKQAVVVRVVGAAAAKGTVTLVDRAGAPIATLRIDAKYPSSSVNIKYLIEVGSLADTFKLTVRSIELGGYKEIYDNLKMDTDSITFVNQNSKLVDLVNLASATAAPNNMPALVVVEATLPAGSDDFAGLTDASYIGTDSGSARTGLQALNSEEYGTGQVAMPGITTAPAHAALVAHANAYHRLAAIDPAVGSDKAAVAAIRALYDSSRACINWPWVEVIDPSVTTGIKKFIPPSSILAGCCAQADRTIGTHKSPGNIIVPNAIGVERFASGASQTDDATHEYLNARDVNVIKQIPEAGIRFYGGRVIANASPSRRVSFIHEARLLNLFYYSAKLAYSWAPFSVVDGTGKLFRDLRSTGRAFLRDFFRAGALYAETGKEEEAFVVIADATNNPSSELDNGRVHVQWGVRISPTAEQVIINIDNVPLSQSIAVLQ